MLVLLPSMEWNLPVTDDTLEEKKKERKESREEKSSKNKK